jgi:5-methylcytosine-specific restriction endonuclease McrA
MPKTDIRRKRKRLLSGNPTCHYCNRPLRDGLATLEHIVPKSLGGSNDDANCVIACRRCNNERGDTGRPCHCPKCAAAWATYDRETP